MAYMTDANTIRERFKDSAVGHLRTGSSCSTTCTTSTKKHVISSARCSNWRKRVRFASSSSRRPSLSVYDRQDVHIRDTVRNFRSKA